MPRTYSKFLGNDVVILSDANRDAFRTEHFNWMKRGVIEEGLGLVMIGGAESFADPSWPSWKPTEVADVLPCEMIPSVPRFSGGMVKILDWEDEFILSKTIGGVEEQKDRAMDLYVGGSIEESLGAFAEVLELCEEAMDEAIDARNAAAFWILFTEWCVVTGISFFTGFCLWLVMIRRRLYREVKTTRLIPSD